MPPPRKICMVRFGGMGDILLATPALRALSVAFDTVAIDVIVGRGMADAVTGIPYIRNVTEWDKKGADGKVAEFVRLLTRLRRERYDLFLNFQPGTRANLMAWASGARRVTFRKDRRKQPDTGRVRHAIDDFAKELKPLGIASVADRRMDFHVPDAARESCRAKLDARGVLGRYVVVNPAATRLVNRYPPERFAEAIIALSDALPGVTFVLSGAPNEWELVDAVLGCVTPDANAVSLAGVLSLKELGALLAGAECVVTGDTGPLHIASAVGAPIVCLSGAADPDRTGPTAPRDLVVIRRDLSCVPCQDRVCRRGDIACMTGLPVEWVVRAALKRMEAR